MWEDGGILRNREGLTRALDAVKKISAETRASTSGPGSADLKKALERRAAIRAATLILEAALRRRESRGAHFREDFPKQDDQEWLGHLQVRVTPEGEEVWLFQPEKP
jgi:succinate dehydrogenase/fumarate reductase flavoprotein subunit